MNQFTRLAAALVAVAGFFGTTSHAVPPDTVIDTLAVGTYDVRADVTVPGIGTLKVSLESVEGIGLDDVVAVQSRTPGRNFPPVRLPFVVMAGEDMDRTITLGRSEITDRRGDFLGAFVLSQLSSTRASVKDQLLFLQHLPFFNDDTSLADTLVNSIVRGSFGQGVFPNLNDLAPDDPLRDVYAGLLRVTRGKVNGVLRGSRGNSRYRGRWSMRWEGHIDGGPLDGTEVRGRVSVRFTSTAEPIDRPPDPLPQPAGDTAAATARGE